MKVLVLFTIFFALPFTLSAQETEVENYAFKGFLGGISVPSGDFGKITGENSGAALLGFSGGFINYPMLSGDSGFGFEFRVTVNSFDTGELEDALEEVGFYGLSVDGGNYINAYLLGGYGFTLRQNIMLKGNLGVQYATYPGFEISNGFSSSEVTADGTITIAYGLGCTAKVGERFLIDFTYLTSKPEFELESEDTSETEKGKIDETMMLISIGFLF